MNKKVYAKTLIYQISLKNIYINQITIKYYCGIVFSFISKQIFINVQTSSIFFFLVFNLNPPLLSHSIHYINTLINFISSLNILPQQNKNKIFSFSLKKYVRVYGRVGSTLKTASPTRCTLTHWTTLYNKPLKLNKNNMRKGTWLLNSSIKTHK